MNPRPARVALARLVAAALAAVLAAPAAGQQTRPNILWLVAEDLSPTLGCYGDETARTPTLDAMAESGVRYTNAFANAPVCAVARSTLIYGVYATTLGTQNMRSQQRVPERFEHFTHALRRAGYYTSNRAKTDFNDARPDDAAYDASGPDASYTDRPEAAPFFAVINGAITHESRVEDPVFARLRASGDIVDGDLVDPDALTLPPYLPDLPEIRQDRARAYATVNAMDRWAAERLDELERSGAAADTIVFFFGDHGGNLARSKRFLYDGGVRVPLVVRIPERWRRLLPAARGSAVERPVSFVDFAPTVLNLARVEIPGAMQGTPFMGRGVGPADAVWLFRNRMDERIDVARGLRTPSLHYVMNLMPHRPHGQHLAFPFDVQAGWRAWWEADRRGETQGAERLFWQRKPFEELYDTAADPWQVVNLAAWGATTAPTLARFRGEAIDRMIATRDTGLIPESMFAALAGEGGTVHDYAASEAYPVELVVDTAVKAAEGSRAHDADLIARLGHPHPVVRYWAAVGFNVRASAGQTNFPTRRLSRLLDDRFPANRVAAAESLAVLPRSGSVERARAVLRGAALGDDALAAVLAMNTIEAAGLEPLLTDEELRGLAGPGAADRRVRDIAAWWLERRRAD